jgi:hypothetical protein
VWLLLHVKELGDPVSCVERGLCDPVREFIKKEPHKRSKLERGSLRAIWNVSLLDQLIDRALFSAQNQYEIEHWRTCPSKPGMGLNTEEQRSSIRSIFSGKMVDSDMSGWDISVQEHELLAEAFYRAELGCSSDPVLSPWRKLVYRRFRLMSRKIVSDSNGEIWWCGTGIIPSGAYVTSSSNSRIRVENAFKVGAKVAYAMGDDCAEERVADAEETKRRYLSLGHVMKSYNDQWPFEFCSHRFYEDGRVEFLNVDKTLYRLLSSTAERQERWDEFREVAIGVDLDEIEALLCGVGWPVGPHKFYAGNDKAEGKIEVEASQGYDEGEEAAYSCSSL